MYKVSAGRKDGRPHCILTKVRTESSESRVKNSKKHNQGYENFST